VGFSFAAFAMRKLVSGESFFITRCGGKRRRFREELRGMFVVDVFVAIEARERFVELRALGVVLDSALEEILSELEILALGLDSQSESRLRWIIQRGDARIPSHVPGGHVPEKNRSRLQRRDLPEKKKDAAPFRPFPGDVRLDKKSVGDERTKPTQRGDEAQLPELFAQTQIEIDRAEMQLPMRRRNRMFHRSSGR